MIDFEKKNLVRHSLFITQYVGNKQVIPTRIWLQKNSTMWNWDPGIIGEIIGCYGSPLNIPKTEVDYSSKVKS